jgi:hypothetical protein
MITPLSSLRPPKWSKICRYGVKCVVCFHILLWRGLHTKLMPNPLTNILHLFKRKRLLVGESNIEEENILYGGAVWWWWEAEHSGKCWSGALGFIQLSPTSILERQDRLSPLTKHWSRLCFPNQTLVVFSYPFVEGRCRSVFTNFVLSCSSIFILVSHSIIKFLFQFCYNVLNMSVCL